ncbi:uncharacterized protein BJ171DRAFT_494938 [Polychytrium aggregatum]|uniref:uncharacterized protein n=1 Tax=Polychytrium aggregatum TaxID=110093 RepID=UPI0022FF0C0E|nr:uncharacterized protein BJ171DRAFT_494938 [Polychytrium aggregatum]KAI9206836.1 hypothetical protein BJ171DRAFT_494938 [Polychytrium aggregatum]
MDRTLSRQHLVQVIRSICADQGCDEVEDGALDVIYEMMIAFFVDVSTKIKLHGEHTLHSAPSFYDMILPLQECGIEAAELVQFFHSLPRPTSSGPELQAASEAFQNAMVIPSDWTLDDQLQTWTSIDRTDDPLPDPIPKYFPTFPQKHSYMSTKLDSKKPAEGPAFMQEYSLQARQVEDNLRLLLEGSALSAEQQHQQQQHQQQQHGGGTGFVHYDGPICRTSSSNTRR